MKWTFRRFMWEYGLIVSLSLAILSFSSIMIDCSIQCKILMDIVIIPLGFITSYGLYLIRNISRHSDLPEWQEAHDIAVSLKLTIGELPSIYNFQDSVKWLLDHGYAIEKISERYTLFGIDFDGKITYLVAALDKEDIPWDEEKISEIVPLSIVEFEKIINQGESNVHRC